MAERLSEKYRMHSLTKLLKGMLSGAPLSEIHRRPHCIEFILTFQQFHNILIKDNYAFILFPEIWF